MFAASFHYVLLQTYVMVPLHNAIMFLLQNNPCFAAKLRYVFVAYLHHFLAATPQYVSAAKSRYCFGLQAYRRVVDAITSTTGLKEGDILDLRGNHDMFGVPRR